MDHAVHAPEELGVDRERLESLRGRVRHAVDKGPLPSVQMALARRGKLVLFETFGAADNDTRYTIYSCTKPVVASALWKLMGQGLIDITRNVADYLPPFGENGKESVTVEQVMCHTSGFPDAPMGDPDWWDSQSRLAKMATWHLQWEPGTQVVYHPTSAHWVLAELVSAVAGVDYRDYVNGEILDPLGLAALRVGGQAATQHDVAHLSHVGEPPGEEELQALFGQSVNWPDTRDDSLLRFNEPEVRALGVPGGGAVSSAADMALFYQALLANPDGLWDQAVLDDAIGTVRVDFPDPITGAPANRGLGVVIAGDDAYLSYRGMGDKVSPRAIGHQGVGGQVGWGDPVTGLSFALFTNGLDANPLRSARLCAAASNRAGACVERSW